MASTSWTAGSTILQQQNVGLGKIPLALIAVGAAAKCVNAIASDWWVKGMLVE
jgi:hypothetical protein